MLHQGEKISFSGSFETLVGEVWTTITDLSSYTISALVFNPETRTKIAFSTETSAENKITISQSKYSFAISSTQSAGLKGMCRLDIALQKGEDIIISDNTGEFIVKESTLGRAIAETNEEDTDNE